MILLDWLNTKFTDQAYARQQVIKFLRQIKPEDRIGIYALGGSLTVLHNYTADLRAPVVAVGPQRECAEPAKIGAGGIHQRRGDARYLVARPGAPGAERGFWTVNRVASTCRALEFIGNHLARVPGRKNIIWVSGGFPLNIGFDSTAVWRDPSRIQTTFSTDIDRAVRALNNGDVAVYPVDARGLMTDPAFSAERRGSVSMGRDPLRPPVGVRNQQMMQELASRTGGKAYYNSNDITGAIGQAIADSSPTYTLGFYPMDPKFDGKFHTLKVHVNRDGQKVRYRKGYFDMTDQPTDEAARKVELRNAVFSPLDATELGVTVHVTPSAKSGPMDVAIAVAPRGITLQQQADRWNGMLDLLVVQKDDRGNQFNGTNSKVEMRLQKPNYDKIAKDGVVYRQAVTRSPKATQLKVIVRDAASGSVGSPNAEYYGLLVPLCVRLGQPVDRLVLEVGTQDVPALIDAVERYHHREHAAGLEPAKELFQK